MTDTVNTTEAVLSNATVIKLLEQLTAQNAASQAAAQQAAQASQQVNQSIADLLTKMSQQTSSQQVATQTLMEETGFGERFQVSQNDRSDAYQRLFHTTATQAQQEIAALNKIVLEHLQNATTTIHSANTEYLTVTGQRNRQMVNAGDLATHHMWESPVFEDAVLAAVSKAVNEALAKKA